jgi:hypothetical protein
VPDNNPQLGLGNVRVMHVAVEIMMVYDFYKGLQSKPKLVRDNDHAEEHVKVVRHGLGGAHV